MEEALGPVVEMNQRVWDALRGSLNDLTGDEIHWRMLPQANSINIIVRHLRLEAEWHLRSLEHGKPMPTIAVEASQEDIDKVGFDFQENLEQLEVSYERFLEILRSSTIDVVRKRTTAAYGEVATRGRTYLIAYHQAMHAAMHCGQIRTIRNLYAKTRGQAARFHPENPTYPRQQP